MESLGGDPPAARGLAPHRHPAFRTVLVAGLLLLAVLPVWWPPLEHALFEAEGALTRLLPLDRVGGLHWVALPAAGLVGGLLASVSPCVLPLVPLNAAYVGAGRLRAARATLASAGFVAGAVLTLSIVADPERGELRSAFCSAAHVAKLVNAPLARADEFPDLVADAASPIDDVRGTASYRRHALRVLAARGLERCLAA